MSISFILHLEHARFYAFYLKTHVTIKHFFEDQRNYANKIVENTLPYIYVGFILSDNAC